MSDSTRRAGSGVHAPFPCLRRLDMAHAASAGHGPQRLGGFFCCVRLDASCLSSGRSAPLRESLNMHAPCPLPCSTASTSGSFRPASRRALGAFCVPVLCLARWTSWPYARACTCPYFVGPIAGVHSFVDAVYMMQRGRSSHGECRLCHLDPVAPRNRNSSLAAELVRIPSPRNVRCTSHHSSWPRRCSLIGWSSCQGRYSDRVTEPARNSTPESRLTHTIIIRNHAGKWLRQQDRQAGGREARETSKAGEAAHVDHAIGCRAQASVCISMSSGEEARGRPAKTTQRGRSA